MNIVRKRNRDGSHNPKGSSFAFWSPRTNVLFSSLRDGELGNKLQVYPSSLRMVSREPRETVLLFSVLRNRLFSIAQVPCFNTELHSLRRNPCISPTWLRLVFAGLFDRRRVSFSAVPARPSAGSSCGSRSTPCGLFGRQQPTPVLFQPPCA